MSAGISRRVVVALCVSFLIAGVFGATARARGASEHHDSEDRIVATFTKWVTN